MKIDQNFVAVVTGGASGLGKGAVKLLASLGAKVVIASTNEQKGKLAAEENNAHFFKTDITD